MQTESHSNATRLTLIYALVIAAIAITYKVLPRYLVGTADSVLWNLAPMGALALFVGSRVRAPYAYLVPLGAMFLGDLLLIPLLAPQFSSISLWTPLIYASFALYVLIGRAIGQRELSPLIILPGAVVGSVQFFLVTNFLCWPGNPEYPQSFAGLMQCYAAGLPFFRSTLLSDALFTLVFFALHAVLLRGLVPAKLEQPA